MTIECKYFLTHSTYTNKSIELYTNASQRIICFTSATLYQTVLASCLRGIECSFTITTYQRSMYHRFVHSRLFYEDFNNGRSKILSRKERQTTEHKIACEKQYQYLRLSNLTDTKL